MTDADLVLKTKIEIFKAVIELDPQAPVFVELAESLIADGRPEEAIEICRRGLEHHPELLAGRVAMIEALLAAGNTEEARQAFSSARKEASLARRYLGRLGGLADDLSLVNEPPAPLTGIPVDELPEPKPVNNQAPPLLTPELLAELLGGEGMQPDKVEASISSPTLADLYISQGYRELAIEVIKRLIDSDPDNPALQSRLDELGRETSVVMSPPARAESSDLEIPKTAENELDTRQALPRESLEMEYRTRAPKKEPGRDAFGVAAAPARDESLEIDLLEELVEASPVPMPETEEDELKNQMGLAGDSSAEDDKLRRMEMAGILTRWRDAIRERLAREQT